MTRKQPEPLPDYPRPPPPPPPPRKVVRDNRKLVAFLYVLMRDDVVPGRIETILDRHVFDIESEYSNVHLARYAQDVAGRLQQRPEAKP